MTEMDDFRNQKDLFFHHDPDSPLSAKQRRRFQGLSYYPEDPSLRLVARVERLTDAEIVQMNTSTGDAATYRRWGRFSFVIAGQPATLTIYQDTEGDSLFLPFADATSGKETYGAGRYLEPRELPDGSVLVDFNQAYNPYCAYNDRWSCPVPPRENRLSVAIRAGEKAFSDSEH